MTQQSRLFQNALNLFYVILAESRNIKQAVSQRQFIYQQTICHKTVGGNSSNTNRDDVYTVIYIHENFGGGIAEEGLPVFIFRTVLILALMMGLHFLI